MFEATRPFLVFDYFRVPYSTTAVRDGPEDGWAWLRRAGTDGPRLYWPTPEAEGLGPPAEYRLESSTVFARTVRDSAAAARPAVHGGWRPSGHLYDAGGRRWASLAQADDGSVLLPFAPDEAVTSLWSETYHCVAQPSSLRQAKRLALRTYYALRPGMPRTLQIALRRRLARLQARRRFPAWPQETSLHDLYEIVLSLTASVAGEPVPTLAPWPNGLEWALVLTHDVERQIGFDNIHRMADLERSAGYRSAWNLVPRRYTIDEEVVRRLKVDGFEVGVHGLYHDGRDLESEARLRERLPAIQEAARRWSATGFRSPATHRRWELMPLLGFDHDSSYPDTDPFEPYGGGCCSWLPFFNRDLVELPITLLQDHTLFAILRRNDEALWVEKTDFLRSRGGMALLITHPDYMLDSARLCCYRRLLERYANDASAWRALPAEVSAWWRRRGASCLVRRDDAWSVEGDAADEARVVLVESRETGQAA